MEFTSMGILCPIENIAPANQAATQLSEMPGDINTFVPEMFVTRESDGKVFCYAHGAIPDFVLEHLPDLADQLGGILFETSGDFWEQIEVMGFVREEPEDD